MSLSILPASRWLPKRRPPMVVKRQSRHAWPRLRWETRVRPITYASISNAWSGRSPNCHWAAPIVAPLELGSHLQMATVMERILGYGSVQSANYSAWIGRDSKTLQINGKRAFTADIDLFNAEFHSVFGPSVDVVVSCELIEHLLRDPLHMLLESWRVLKDGGPNTSK